MISKEQSEGFDICLTNGTKRMIGNMLTLVEATGMVGPQVWAVKDLVKREMWRFHKEVSQFFRDHIAREFEPSSAEYPDTENQ